MSRSYRHWMECVAIKKKECRDLNLVIRHDVDFDIHTARKMLEIEKDFGLSSVIYLDVHSPSYGLPEILSLCRDFQDLHDFGIHINVAYDHSREDDCCQAYDEDLQYLRAAGIFPHSCAAHYYDTRILPVPEFHNGHIESWSQSLNMLQQEFYPQGFHPLHFLGQQTSHLTDGGGILPYGGISDFLKSLKPNDKAYLLLHPVHYERNGTDVIYAKRFGEGINPRKAQEKIVEKTTSYLGMPVADIPHLYEAHRIITERARERYREMIRIIDAGCGIGLLGAYLLHYNNLKYTGFDISPEFIEVGREFFELQGYCPRLYVANIYDHQPEGDILAFLGYEDCDTDYDQLLEICAKYPEVLITIASESMHAAAEARGKHYHYIGEKEFEGKFGKAFNIVERIAIPKKRTLYHLKRKYK